MTRTNKTEHRRDGKNAEKTAKNESQSENNRRNYDSQAAVGSRGVFSQESSFFAPLAAIDAGWWSPSPGGAVSIADARYAVALQSLAPCAPVAILRECEQSAGAANYDRLERACNALVGCGLIDGYDWARGGRSVLAVSWPDRAKWWRLPAALYALPHVAARLAEYLHPKTRTREFSVSLRTLAGKICSAEKLPARAASAIRGGLESVRSVYPLEFAEAGRGWERSYTIAQPRKKREVSCTAKPERERALPLRPASLADILDNVPEWLALDAGFAAASERMRQAEGAIDLDAILAAIRWTAKQRAIHVARGAAFSPGEKFAIALRCGFGLEALATDRANEARTAEERAQNDAKRVELREEIETRRDAARSANERFDALLAAVKALMREDEVAAIRARSLPAQTEDALAAKVAEMAAKQTFLREICATVSARNGQKFDAAELFGARNRISELWDV